MFKVRMMSGCRLVAFIYSQPLWVHEESTDGFFLGGGDRRKQEGFYSALKRVERKAEEKAECGTTCWR